MHIHYDINIKRNQIVNVEAFIELLEEERNVEYIKVTMPKWTDGSYQYLDHIKNVTFKSPNMIPTDENNEFLIKVDNRNSIAFKYDIFANENSVRSIFSSSERFYAAPQALFMYPEIDGNSDYHIASYKVNSWEYNQDDNIELFFGSSFQPEKTIPLKNLYKEYILVTPESKKISWSFHNDFAVEHNFTVTAFNMNDEKINTIHQHKDFFIENLKKITSHTMRKTGYIPFEKYNFYLHLEEGEYGGVEFDSSSITLVSYSWLDLFKFDDNKEFEDKNVWKALEVLTHEYFHAWNVRNIKPIEFKPEYESLPQYSLNKLPDTSSLWVFEGLTSFMGKKLMKDAGVISQEKLDKLIFEDYKYVYDHDGWKQPLLASANNAYIQLYKRNPNSKHHFTNYYKKGCLLWSMLENQINNDENFYKFLDNIIFKTSQITNENLYKTKYIDTKKISNGLLNVFDKMNQPELKEEFNLNGIITRKIVPSRIKDKVTQYENEKQNKQLLSSIIEVDDSGKVISISPNNNYDVYLNDKIIKINEKELINENNLFNKVEYDKIEKDEFHKITLLRKNEEIMIESMYKRNDLKNKVKRKL